MIFATLRLALALHVLVPGVLIDRVLVTVAGHPVTMSEVEVEGRLLLALRGGQQALSVGMDDEFYCGVVDTVVHQYLIAAEADRLRLEPASPAAIEAALSGLRQRFSSVAQYEHFLAQFELTAADLSAVFARHLRVEQLLENRVTLRVSVTTADMDAAVRARTLRDARGSPHRSRLGTANESPARLDERVEFTLRRQLTYAATDEGAPALPCAPKAAP